jgi:protein-S-isoprenylcysteine O-methyltransferase Ste14
MEMQIGSAIGWAWAAVGAVWFAGTLSSKRTVRVQPFGARFFQLAVLAVGFTLLGWRRLAVGWLGARFVPALPAVAVLGVAITIAGCAFAIWARFALGANWSARAAVKEGHELITWGPYAVTRHPIYTGLLAAVAGTALAGGEWRHALGLAVILFGFLIKMSQEERLMAQAFPDAYPRYRRRVKALIPGLL